MAISNNKKDRTHAAYIINTEDGGTDRRVNDQITHSKLDTIATGIGANPVTPSITNVTTTATTEEAIALPANTNKFILKSRNKSTIRLAFSATETATNYVTIPPGASYEDDNLYTSLTIYVWTSKGDTIELVTYV